MQSMLTFLLISFVLGAACCDLKNSTIPNWLTVPFFLLGLIWNYHMAGFMGLTTSLLGGIWGCFILLIPFLWGWVGGGDVKFLAAAGTLVGPEMIIYSTLWGLILFGIAAFVFLLLRRRLKIFLKQLIFMLISGPNSTGISMIEVSGRLPLGVFLGIGIILNWFL